MPRKPRLDIAGLLYHVIGRGVEHRQIFMDDEDRSRFITRFSDLLQETDTQCYAWALLPNHFHILLRPTREKLSYFMRRLLTGYAVGFNLRHGRSGHLFQNRYKSLICEEETYLLELIRYIHLNPLRAGMVNDLLELARYPWSGHSILLGGKQMAGQVTDDILLRFGKQRKKATRKYIEFMADGVDQERRDELGGGGKRRSVIPSNGATAAAMFDDRIIGSGNFVLAVQHQAFGEKPATRMALNELISRVAAYFEVAENDLTQRTRRKNVVDARGVICFTAVRVHGYQGSEVGRAINMERSGVSLAVSRGKRLIQENHGLKLALELTS